MGRAGIERVLCDANVRRVVFAGRSEIIDVGRKTRTISAPLRAAIVARDGRCRMAHCDQPPARCDVHHIVPWFQGGPTDADNLILACRYHHWLLHDGGFTLIRGPDGTHTLTRPDGTTVT